MCGSSSFAQVGRSAGVWVTVVVDLWVTRGVRGWFRASPDPSTDPPGCPHGCPQVRDCFWGRTGRPESLFRVIGSSCAQHVGNLWNQRGQRCGCAVDRLWAGCGGNPCLCWWEIRWHCGQSAHTVGKTPCVQTIFASLAKHAYAPSLLRGRTRASGVQRRRRGVHIEWTPRSRCGIRDVLLAGALLDARRQLLHLVVDPPALGHLLADLLVRVHDGRVVAAAERLPDLRQ